jgi:integral membrane protein (TIGR01906 family)
MESRPLAWLGAFLQGGVALCVPFLLTLGGVRLLLTEPYLRVQYAFLPPDRFGLTHEQRLYYGTRGLRYLVNDAPPSYLGELELEGRPAFNERELQHMADVKTLTRGAGRVFVAALGLFTALSLAAGRLKRWAAWRAGLRYGGRLTLGLAGSALGLALVAWDFFFDSFHALFFADGTWLFYIDDTLIRLYPELFWQTSALLLGLLVLGGASLLAFHPATRPRRAINQT